MQGSDYIFCVQDDNYNFWRVNPDGSVSLSTQPYFLDFSPDGWDDIAIQNLRNKLYKGIDRTVSLGLGYVLDGSKILKHIAYTKGFNQKTYLSVAAQKLKYNDLPIGTLTGGGTFGAGTSTGTILTPIGETTYLLISITTANALDEFYGTIGGTISFSVGGTNPSSVLIPISAPGLLNWTGFLFDTSGGVSTASVTLVNSAGNAFRSYGFWYKQVFRGLIDWASFDHAGSKVTCSTLEDGLPMYLKANDKTTYEYPMNVPEAVFVKADGIILHQRLNYVCLDGVTIEMGTGNGQMLPILFISSTGDSTGVSVNSEDYKIVPITSNAFAEGLTNNVLKNFGTTPVTYLFEGNADVFCTEKIASSGTFNLRVGITKYGTTVSNTLIASIPDPAVGFTYPIVLNHSFTLQPGECLFFFSFSPFIGTTYSMVFTNNAKFSCKYTTRYQTTYIRALRAQYLFEKLITSATEGNYSAADCNFLNVNRTKVFTCGNAIRLLDDALIKISLQEYFKHWDSLYSVALVDRPGYKVEMGEEEDLIDAINYIELPEPALSSMRVSVAKELLFNELEIGFPEIRNEIGVLNGKQEFNDKMLFSTSANTSPGRIDKVSSISASSYEMEKLRISNIENPTTDNKNDNKNYTLHIQDTLQPAVGDIPEHYLLDRTLNAFVTDGLTEPGSVFNLWFSPRRSISRMAKHLHGRFYKSDALNLTFRSADQNKNLVCDGVIEADNINIGSLPVGTGLPIYFDFEVPPPFNLLELLDTNPLQVFRFPFQGDYYFGMLEQIKIVPSKNKSQSITLRSTILNNHDKLIEYYG